MSRSQKFLGALLLVGIILAGWFLSSVKAHQRLGEPGVKIQNDPTGTNLEVLLPENLPGYTSRILTNVEATLHTYLPPDTSCRVRSYQSSNDFFAELSVVVMGSDRTSIHKPEICLPAQGWNIDTAQTGIEIIPMNEPVKYDLRADKILVSQVIKKPDGSSEEVHGIYLYWFVDSSHCTENALLWKLWWMPRDLILHGVLERWGYVALFSPCYPGQEAATLEKMKKLITVAIPQFQQFPSGAVAGRSPD